MLAGIIAAAGLDNAPRAQLIAYSALVYAVDTSQSPTIPAASTDDLLLAWVMHRSTMASVPAGWALEDSANLTGGGTTQYLSLYSKTSNGSEGGTSPTWQQSSSMRIGVQIQVFRHTAGDILSVLDTSSDTHTGLASVPMATVTATSDGQLAIPAVSWISGATLPSSSTISAPSGYTLTTPPTTTDNRLGICRRRLNDMQAVAGSMTTTVDPNVGAVALSALIGVAP